MDEAAHAVGSWVLLEGGRLYTDFVDNKPPLLYALLRPGAAAARAGPALGAPAHGGAMRPRSPRSARLPRFRHDRRGVTAALLWLVYGASFLAHDMLAANAELILLLPASWAIAVVADEQRAARRRSAAPRGSAARPRHAGEAPGRRSGYSPSAGRPCAPGQGRSAPSGPENPSIVPSSLFLALAAGFALPLLATWLAFAATGGARTCATGCSGATSSTPRTRSRPLARSSERRATCCHGCWPRRRSSGRGPGLARPRPAWTQADGWTDRVRAAACARGLPLLPPLLRARRLRPGARRGAGRRPVVGAAAHA